LPRRRGGLGSPSWGGSRLPHPANSDHHEAGEFNRSKLLLMLLTANPEKLPPPTPGATATVSPGLEWLWQRFSDVRHPHILDCGSVRQSTVNVLLRRGAKLYVTDLLSPLQRSDPAFWDRRGKQPRFLLEPFLAQLPDIPLTTLSAVLCGHLLDLLPRESLSLLVNRLCSYLQPGGVLFCLLREPYLAAGAAATWWLESLTTLGVAGENRGAFHYAALTNREMERLVPSGAIKTFLTRSGRREVLAFK